MASKLIRLMTYIPRLFSCEEYSRNVSANLDRHLDKPAAFALKFHHIYCSFCRKFRAQIDLMDRGFKKLAEDDQNGDVIQLDNDARSRIRAKLRQGDR